MTVTARIRNDPLFSNRAILSCLCMDVGECGAEMAGGKVGVLLGEFGKLHWVPMA